MRKLQRQAEQAASAAYVAAAAAAVGAVLVPRGEEIGVPVDDAASPIATAPVVVPSSDPSSSPAATSAAVLSKGHKGYYFFDSKGNRLPNKWCVVHAATVARQNT